MTPQLYSQANQQRQRLAGQTMHNSHLNQKTGQQQQLGSTMNSSQSYQQAVGNKQVFFRKRASSNTNSQHHNIIASPQQDGNAVQSPKHQKPSSVSA
jgi:hypothetical protein